MAVSLIRGAELVHHRPRDLGLVKLHAPYAQEGENGQAQENDAHAPSQWVRLRQNNRPLGMISTSRMTEAPVVVKPETDSKMASTGELKIPLQKNGRAPNTPTANHPEGGDGHAFPVGDGGPVGCCL